MSDKYWMVLRSPDVSNGKLALVDRPSFVHDTRESAEKEAERLALKFNDSFLVLEGVAWVHATEVKLSKLPGTVPVYEVLQ